MLDALVEFHLPTVHNKHHARKLFVLLIQGRYLVFLSNILRPFLSRSSIATAVGEAYFKLFHRQKGKNERSLPFVILHLHN